MTSLPPIEEIECWTDGACDGGGRGGWAFILTAPANPFAYYEASGPVPEATSQRMELMALVMALTHINNAMPDWASTIAVHTDSSYLKNCFTQRWHVKWRRNGWLNSKNEPVANRDLWEQLLQLMEFHTIRWVKIRGHRGVELNERCDMLAVKARLALKARDADP